MRAFGALALIALLVGANLAASSSNPHNSNNKKHRREMDSNEDRKEMTHKEYRREMNSKHHQQHNHPKRRSSGYERAKAFRAGYEYQFKYDAQTSTGFADMTISPQRAMNRIQANVWVTFLSQTEATMCLHQVRLAQNNGVLPTMIPGSTPTDATRLQPIRAFAHRILPSDSARGAKNKSDEAKVDVMADFEAQLQTPVRFSYEKDGSVSSIRFSKSDGAAARNLKKSILNLMQLRLKSKQQVDAKYCDDESCDSLSAPNGGNNYNELTERKSQAQRANVHRLYAAQLANAWTSAETTIEGNCAAMYTVWGTDCENQADNFGANPNINDISNEECAQNARDNAHHYNVTKSIDFKRCAQTADVLFGYQMIPTVCQNDPQNEAQNEDENSAESTDEKNSEETIGTMCENAVSLPERALHRSTVMRYTIRASHADRIENAEGGANKYGLERVSLISEYRFHNGDNEQKSSRNAMNTVAVAELVFEDSVSAGNGNGKKNADENEQNASFSSDNASARRIKYEDNAAAETLLYNAKFEAREKRFYAFGDAKEDNGGDSEALIAEFFLRDMLQSEESAQADATKNTKSERAAQIMARAEAAFDEVVAAFVDNYDEGAEGISAPQVAENFKSLVELMRMCTMVGLKRLQTRAVAADKGGKFGAAAPEIFADALATAGTHNALQMLAEMMQYDLKGLNALKTLKVLGSGAAFLAPSDAQADTLLKMCQSVKDDNEKARVGDACWLTFATIVGQLETQRRRASSTQKAPNSADERVETHKMDLYKNVLVDALKNAKTSLEKIVALKRCGNAGLHETIRPILDVAQDAEQSHDVRLHAIDALRRFVAPRFADAEAMRAAAKTVAGLLPIFANVQERADVRIASVRMLLTGAGGALNDASLFSACSAQRAAEKKCALSSWMAIADQIAYVMQNERSEDVRGFVASICDAMASSPLRQQRELAQHITSAMANVKPMRHAFTNVFTRHSHYSHVHFDSAQSDCTPASTCANSNLNAELLANYYVIYTSKRQRASQANSYDSSEQILSALPAQVSLEFDSYIGGEYQRSTLQLSAVQNNLEAVAREFMSQLRARYYNNRNGGDEQQKSKESKQTKGFIKKAIEGIENFVTNALHLGQHSDEVPYAMLTVRNNDADVLVLPITNATIDPLLALVDGSSSGNNNNGKMTRLKRAVAENENQVDRMIRAVIPLDAKMARIPTSLGMPLKIDATMFGFGALTLEAKSAKFSPTSIAANLAVQPNFGVAQLSAMRVWVAHGQAGASAGVVAKRLAEMNVPLSAQARCELDAQRCELQLPLSQKSVRIFGFHSLPYTFIAAPTKTAQEILADSPASPSNAATRAAFRELSCDAADAHAGSLYDRKFIENSRMSAQQREIDASWMKEKEALNLPIRVHGHYYEPRTLSAGALADALASSADSSVHVDFEPHFGETPQAIKITLDGALFQYSQNADQMKNDAQERMGGVQNTMNDAQNTMKGAQNKMGGAQNTMNGAQNKMGGTQNKMSGAQNRMSGAQSMMENGAQNKMNNVQKTPWSRIRDGLDAFYAGFESVFFSTNKESEFEQALNNYDSDEDDFAAGGKMMRNTYSEQPEENGAEQLKSYAKAHKNAHDYLRRTLEKSVPYSHTLHVVAETIGARIDAQADMELYAVCDAKMRACETRLDMMRTKWFASESQPWAANAQLQVIYPEVVKKAAELDTSASDDAPTARRHAKLFTLLWAEWGPQEADSGAEKQRVKINVLGEPSAQMIRDAVDAEEGLARRQQMKTQRTTSVYDSSNKNNANENSRASAWHETVPFLDQYNMVAQYELNADAENWLYNAISALKSEYFWQTKSRLRTDAQQKQQSEADGGAQTIKAVLRVDAQAPMFANLSLETPMERVFVRTMPTPPFVPLVALISPAMARASALAADASDMEQRGIDRMFSRFLPSPLAKFVDTMNAVENDDQKMCRVGKASDDAPKVSVIDFRGKDYMTTLSSKCFTLINGACTAQNNNNNSNNIKNNKNKRNANNNKNTNDLQNRPYTLAVKSFPDNEAKKVIRYKPLGGWKADAYTIKIEPISSAEARLAVTVNGTRYTSQTASFEEREYLGRTHGVVFDAEEERREVVSIYKPNQFRLFFDGILVKILTDVQSETEQCGLCVPRRDSDSNKNYNQNNEAADDTEYVPPRFMDNAGGDDSDEDDKDCTNEAVSAATSNFEKLVAQSRQQIGQQKRKQQQQQQRTRKQQRSTNVEEPSSVTEPTEQTLVVEYNHKICFSRQPVRQCPRGTYAADASGERDFVKHARVPVTCLPRESLETRRLLKQVERQGVATLADYPAGYSESIVLPERCVAY